MLDVKVRRGRQLFILCFASAGGSNFHTEAGMFISGSKSVTKVFTGIEPLNDGVIEVEFRPVHDYALVKAIEVTQE